VGVAALSGRRSPRWEKRPPIPPGTVAQNQRLAISPDRSRIHAVKGVEQPASDLIHVQIGRP
jgi:hypothetical protein